MAYIGQQPFQEFTSVPTKDSFTGDGSTTTFDLANDVVRGSENALEVFVDNVRQEAGSGKAFTMALMAVIILEELHLVLLQQTVLQFMLLMIKQI